MKRIILLSGMCMLGLNMSGQITCADDLVITTDVPANTADNQEASYTITASNTFNEDATGIYHAGREVLMVSGFSIADNAVYRAYIEGCSGDFHARATSMLHKSTLALYPNPARKETNITTDKRIRKIMLLSIEGRTMSEMVFNIEMHTVNIDLTRLAKGLYLVNIVTDEGEVLSQKLIKN